MNKDDGKWITKSSKVIHKNPYFTVRDDEVVRPNGEDGHYHTVEARDAAFIVALDENNNLYLVGLYRYPTGRFSLELPAGGLDGDDALAAAKRELEEEAGLTAKTWKLLGNLDPANALIKGNSYVFLATDLNESANNKQSEEGIITVKKLPFKKVLQMIKDEEIKDTQSIAAITLAGLKLNLIK